MAYDTNLDMWVSSHAIHDLHCMNFYIISHLSNLILKQNMNALRYSSVPGDSWEKRNWMTSHRSCGVRHSGLQNPHIYTVLSHEGSICHCGRGTQWFNSTLIFKLHFSGFLMHSLRRWMESQDWLCEHPFRSFPIHLWCYDKKHSDQKQWKGSKVLCNLPFQAI